MRSMTNDNRRVTKDIDLDFIHYPLSDEAIIDFVKKLNVLPGLQMELIGDIEELTHQDYHGKRIYVKITDSSDYSIESKIDIGVHKHFDIKQEEYTFDDKAYLQRVSASGQRWIDEDIEIIAEGILDVFKVL